MKKLILYIVLALLTTNGSSMQNNQNQFPAGIIYGPKGAFKIDAPKDWILDNKAGLSMDLPCVLYIDGYTWQNSPVIMYSKIASTNYENIDKFINFTIKEFKKEDPKFNHKELKTGEIDSNKYIIMDYQGGPFKGYERVFYIQMEQAVGYVVFSARNEEDFKNYVDAVFEIIESYEYKPKYINYSEKH